jgi:ribosomal protein S8E
MAKKNSDFQITKELQDTVIGNKNIKEVYFNEDGDHYFKKHSVSVHKVDDEGISTGTETVDALPGVELGVVKVGVIENKRKVYKDKLTNVAYTPVAATFTRAEILAAKAIGKTRSEKEKLAILAEASEIAKGQDIQGLLDKLKTQSEAKA